MRIDAPTGEVFQQDDLRERQRIAAVGPSLLEQPPVQLELCFIPIMAWKPVSGLLVLQDLSQSLASANRRAVHSPSGQCCFMLGMSTGFIPFPCLEMRVDGGDPLVAAVGDFAGRQSGCIHHVPFGMHRHFPTRHKDKDTSEIRSTEESLRDTELPRQLLQIRLYQHPVTIGYLKK